MKAHFPQKHEGGPPVHSSLPGKEKAAGRFCVLRLTGKDLGYTVLTSTPASRSRSTAPGSAPESVISMSI